MGSMSAMESLTRVLENHQPELEQQLQERYPSKLIRRFLFENNIYSISVQAELTDGTILDLEPLDIDDLADRFPDCNVGY